MPIVENFSGKLLRTCGARVLEADNIATVKEYITHLIFDLIVTDLALPGEDGATFLKWLRAQPSEKGGATPAIAVTAHYESYPPSQVSGWAAYFQKPVDLDQFVRTIAEILHLPKGKS
jgi:CheY-like chemotaxis protein